ncbi:MAG: hypothetical protein FJX74_10825 [Armatimonadetes bacterium]|nr:hypothetical protein [Armatimonadota bacterium]
MKHPEHDTIWSIALGHEGHVYLGLCLEGKGGGVAQLYRYDTAQRRLEPLADMGEVTGEPPDSGHATQGKIHFALCPARDGKLYGATHCTTPPLGQRVWSPLSMWGDPEMSFPGAHIFRHDTLTGETVDFGVITPNEGIPYLMLDEERECLYGVTYPKAHFFRCDLRGRGFRDYGRVSSWYPIAMIFDGSGNLYTSDTNSQLIKYDVERDRLVFLGTRPYAEPWNTDARYSWITDMAAGPDGWIYGLTYSNDHLFRFDPRETAPVIEDLGPGLPEVRCATLRCMVADREGGLYYLAQPVSPQAPGALLARYDVATGERAVVGRMEREGETYAAWRGVCGEDGALYLATIGRTPACLLVWR